MHKISYIIFHINQAAKARIALAALGAFVLAACSSESSEEVREITDQSPMVFSSTSMTQEETRASAVLQDGFRVWCWKKFGQTGQQVVMDKYQVNYDANAANKWSYENVSGQYIKYWDLAGYPYEFRAVTPHTVNATMSNTGLSVDLSAAGATTFKSQTFLEEVLSQDLAHSEPCLIAQVSRTQSGSDYVDKDLIINQEINQDNKTNATRKVSVPFHHLMSKVGFRFYIDLSEAPTKAITLKKIEISVQNAVTGEKFITESKSYNATNTSGLLNGTFGNLTGETDAYNLLTHTNSPYPDDIRNNHSKETAYNLLLNQDDLLQIPQGNIKIHVNLLLNYRGADTPFEADLYNGDGANPEDYIFSWLPNTHYIYYLHLKSLEKIPIIVCTAELVPWDTVKTSDIVIGL